MKYHSTIKRNNPLLHTVTWMNLQRTILREKSQSKKITYCMVQFIEHSCNDVIAMKIGLVVLGVKDGREGL